MTWVVKGWRTEGLEQLLADEARASVRDACAAAERDARRARRAADRTAAQAAAELEALERTGRELRDAVRQARESVRAAEPAPEPVGAPPSPPALVAVAPQGRRPSRAGRASMRSSALGELFRATSAG